MKPKEFVEQQYQESKEVWAANSIDPKWKKFAIKLAKNAYNQGLEDAKMKIDYEPYSVEVTTPTDNASYTSRRNEGFVDFLMNYEDSIINLKIK